MNPDGVANVFELGLAQQVGFPRSGGVALVEEVVGYFGGEVGDAEGAELLSSTVNAEDLGIDQT